MEKTYNFSNIKFSDLESLVQITPEFKKEKFDEWFSFPYKLSKKERLFLKDLIERHILYLPSYLEDTLKVKFIGPILNQVNFASKYIHDWYHASIFGIINGVEINGFADFMVAKGTREPQKPYFFIQEFKPSIPDRDPEVQLLAEMLIAIEKNKTKVLHGGYIIGQNWKFVILEKIGENNFEYFVSESFDSLKLPDLKQIYINLQAVKLKYCVD